MQTDALAIQVMREQLAEDPMGTEIGLKTLYQALALRQAQVVVLHGQVERIKQQLLQTPKPSVGTEWACPTLALAPTLPVESVNDAAHDGRQTQGTISTDKLR